MQPSHFSMSDSHDSRDSHDSSASSRSRALALARAVLVLSCLTSLSAGCGGAIADVPKAAADGGVGTHDAGHSGGAFDAGVAFDASYPPIDSGYDAAVPFDADCAMNSATLARVPTRFLFEIDGSASTSQAVISEIFTAFSTTVDAMARTADPALESGLILFGDTHDYSCIFGGACDGPYPGLSDVKMALVDEPQRKALNTRFDNALSGDTGSDPILAAIEGGLASFSGEPGVRKALFLITAGAPTDGTGQSIIDSVTKARASDPNLAVYVAGIGTFPSTTTYDPTLLGRIASAGGSASPGCNPNETVTSSNTCYAQIAQATLSDDLFAAIERARETTICSFPMPTFQGPQIDPLLYNLEMTAPSGDVIVPRDPQNGWTFDDPIAPTHMILHGKSCDQYLYEGAAQVTIVTGCYN